MSYTLTLSCPETPGIVHAITTFLVERGCNIVEHQQFSDSMNNELFARTTFEPNGGGLTLDELQRDFAPVADRFDMNYRLGDDSVPRIFVMVSKFGHCLNDLIFRWRAGTLGGELVAVVSNHEDLRPMAEAVGLEFIHVPVSAETKPEAEATLVRLIDEYRADVVVLARYMQVLSDALTESLRGKAINIHHSFLPGFKGAKPYHQAYDRGVKLVGATAHYITADLDEGPIIEQEVIRVDHSHHPRVLASIGRDAEALALSRAVRWHCEHRVLLNGSRTVVFR